MTTSWDDLKEGLTHECFRRSVAQVARDIHCHRSHVYRLISGLTKTPCGPLQDQVARFLAARESHLRHPHSTQPR